MSTITEQAAQRYAAAVIGVLAGHFPAVRDNSLGRILPEKIARQVEARMRSFEVIVTYTREWRLTTETTGWGRSRVRLACYKDRPTGEDSRLERRVNEALRAIKLEG